MLPTWIQAFSALAVAAFTFVLTRVGCHQMNDSEAVQRAFVYPVGISVIKTTDTAQLSNAGTGVMLHFQNSGTTPGRNVYFSANFCSREKPLQTTSNIQNMGHLLAPP